MISDDAVEAAANIIVQGDRGACECRRSIFDKHDVNPPCPTRRQAIRTARIALEAAAPHMLALSAAEIEAVGDMLKAAKAEGWDEGAEAEFERGKFDPHPTNPYRSQA